jgi:hypothetical protein
MATDTCILRVTKNKKYSEKPLLTTNAKGNVNFKFGYLNMTCDPFRKSPSSAFNLIVDLKGTEILAQQGLLNTQEILIQTQGKKVIREIRVNDKLSLRQLVDKFTGFFGFFTNKDFTKVRLDVQS